MTTLAEVLTHYSSREGLWESGNSQEILGLACLLSYPSTFNALLFSRAIDESEVAPGLYRRQPGAVDNLNSHENYVLIAAASSHLGTSHAADIVARGTKHYFMFDNDHPDAFSYRAWHGRHLGVVPLYKFCAGQGSWWGKALLGVRLLWDAFWHGADHDTLDGHVLCLAMTMICRKRGVCGFAVDGWEAAMDAAYGGIRKMLALRFGPDHPFTLYGGAL